MMTLGPTLYVQDSRGAVAFYCEAFHMTIGYHAFHPDGTYLHAELERGGCTIFAVSESSDAAIRTVMIAARQPTMSFGINLDNDEELAHAYEALAREGHVIRPLGPVPWSPVGGVTPPTTPISSRPTTAPVSRKASSVS